MNAEAIRARARELRAAGEALRRRPADEVIGLLGAVLARWRDPRSPERQRLERELPEAAGFTPEVLREGLALGLEPWTPEAWRELARRELGADPGRGARLSAALLAGALPLPTLLGMLTPLAVRSPLLVKTAARDPVTAQLVAESVAAVDAELAACVGVVGFERSDTACLDAFLEAECVIATGSDTAVDAVAARLVPGQRLLRHGHGASLALIGPELEEGPALARAALGIALDTALWDQQGCLSPLAVYVVGDDRRLAQLSAALWLALSSQTFRLPRGRLDAETSARLAHERSTAELRQAAGAGVVLLGDESCSVVREIDPSPRPAPGGRFLRVHPLREPELEEQLSAWAPYLAGVALAGFGERQAELGERLKKLGATRVCEPGRLQAPELGWPRDGLPVLGSLLEGRKQD